MRTVNSPLCYTTVPYVNEKQVHRPGLSHGVLSEVYIPVEKIEDAKSQRKKYTGVCVYSTGACQHHVGWDGRALKEDGIASLGRLVHGVCPSSTV